MARFGKDLLTDPAANRGTGFTDNQRTRLALHGLLPARIESLEQQSARVMRNCAIKTCDLERYIFLMSLQDQNETLFYYTVQKHLKEILPLIYTPTVGEAALNYGAIFRRPRGLYITAADQGHMKEILSARSDQDVRVIVVTDGGRVLGLGDLGANAMPIAISKLALYTVGAGIAPRAALPIVLDVGTKNKTLTQSPFYLGLRQPRPGAAQYLALMDEFVEAVAHVYPKALLQFEDFATPDAILFLERYRRRICSFNDDIQGTAAVALAGIFAALRITGKALADQTLLFVGAGSANIGIAELVVAQLVHQGMEQSAARKKCWFMDSGGLIVKARQTLNAHKQTFAHDHKQTTSVRGAVTAVKPTILIGASGQQGIFDRPVIEAMTRAHSRPIIFALSNPTSRCEISAKDAYTWSKGRALYAAGSPFKPVILNGKTFIPGQANNLYIFPGMGLGITACRIRQVTDNMFLAAAQAVASQVSEANLQTGTLFPDLTQIQTVSGEIAKAIAHLAFKEDLSAMDKPKNLKAHIKAAMYTPDYEAQV